MFKFIILIGLAAGALFWFATPSTPSGGDAMPSSNRGDLTATPQISSSQIQAVLQRRAIFCSIASEVKKVLLADATEREKNLFDLAPNSSRWEVLRSYMLERGSPDGDQLLSSLAVGSIDDIEFGTLDDSIPCGVPSEVGFVLRGSAR